MKAICKFLKYSIVVIFVFIIGCNITKKNVVKGEYPNGVTWVRTSKHSNDSLNFRFQKFDNGNIVSDMVFREGKLHGKYLNIEYSEICTEYYKHGNPISQVIRDSISHKIISKSKMLNDSIFTKKRYYGDKKFKGQYKFHPLLKYHHFSGHPIGYWEEPDSTGMYLLKGYYSNKIFIDTVEIYNSNTNNYDPQLIFYTRKVGKWLKVDANSIVVDTQYYDMY